MLSADSDARAQQITQLVEKGISMQIPPSALSILHMFGFGIGTNGWKAHMKQLKLDGIQWAVTPRPSELEGLGLPSTKGIIKSTRTDMIRVCAFSLPRIRSGAVFLNKTIGVIRLTAVVCDCHPVCRKRIIAEQCVLGCLVRGWRGNGS